MVGRDAFPACCECRVHLGQGSSIGQVAADTEKDRPTSSEPETNRGELSRFELCWMPNDVVSMFAGRSPNGLPARAKSRARALQSVRRVLRPGPHHERTCGKSSPARGVLAPERAMGNIGYALLHGTAYGGGSTPGAWGLAASRALAPVAHRGGRKRQPCRGGVAGSRHPGRLVRPRRRCLCVVRVVS